MTLGIVEFSIDVETAYESTGGRMPTIWVSLNFDLRMTAPLTGAVYPRLSLDRGSLRTGGARRRRIKPKVDSPGRKQTVWHLFVDARLKTVASLRIPWL